MRSGLRHIAILSLLTLGILGCPGSRGGKKRQVEPPAAVARFEYSKIRVINLPRKGKRVHFRLYILNGPKLHDRSMAGLEALAIESALFCGTEDYDAKTFARELERAGARIGHATTEEYSVITFDCLPGHLKQAWKLFTSAILRPSFEPEAFEARKSARIAALEANAETPEGRAEALARKSAFKNTPYGIPPEGSPKTMEGIMVGRAKKYFRKELMKKCRLLLVTVGPIDGEKVADLLFDTLDMLPQGDCSTPPALQEPAAIRRIIAEHREIPVARMVGTMPGPAGGSSEVLPMRVAMHLLGRRLKQRLQIGEPLAFDPEAFYVLKGQGYNVIRFSSHKMVKCAELAMSELRVLRQDGFREDELAAALPSLVATELMGSERAPRLADQLAQCARLDSWALYDRDGEGLKSLNTKDLDAVVRKYLTGISWAIVGDTTRLDRKTLMRF